MKNIFRKLLLICILLFTNVALAQNTNQPNQTVATNDTKEVISRLEYLVNAINEGNSRKAASVISPNNPNLQKEVYSAVQGRIEYNLQVNSITAIDGNKIKATGTFSARGSGWSLNGLQNHFVFEKYSGYWLISDTDFHQKLSQDYALQMLKKIGMVAVPLFLIFGGFWLWMLIDCVRNESGSKWVIVIIFLSILGAILYFFVVRRKRNKMITI